MTRLAFVDESHTSSTDPHQVAPVVIRRVVLEDVCPASSRWQVLGFGKVGGLRVGVAEVDLDGAVPSDRLVGSDGVVLDPVVLGVGCQVQGVWDLFEEHPARTSGTRSRVRASLPVGHRRMSALATAPGMP